MAMPLRLVGVPRLRLWVFVAAALVLFSPTVSLAQVSSVTIPIVMATLLFAALALLAAPSRTRQPSPRAAFAWRGAGCEARKPARQCDPDAAGHVRPRAPQSSPVRSAS
jgi:hypothetical protein